MSGSTSQASRGEIARWRAHLRDERSAARLYRAMAAAEADPQRAGIFREVAEVEAGHAATWEARLREAGIEPGPDRPDRATRLLAWLGRRLGNHVLLPLVRARESRADAGYAGTTDPAARAMRRDEKLHAGVFRAMDDANPRSIAQGERWHRASGGGNLRAAVFGISDGLVSNFSLVMGVAGAHSGRAAIALAGFAGMLAGAFSMAAGEYISMKSQREMFERELAQEEEELRLAPEEEARELELIYRAKGLSPEEAHRLAEKIVADPAGALDTLAREELGLNPDELGSPWGAAGSSFAAFLVGAFVPLLPWLVIPGAGAFGAMLVVSALALLGVGATLSLFTARPARVSGLRMLGIGAAVASATWLIGHLVGVHLS